jgi:hypothetical protein
MFNQWPRNVRVFLGEGWSQTVKEELKGLEAPVA